MGRSKLKIRVAAAGTARSIDAVTKLAELAGALRGETSTSGHRGELLFAQPACVNSERHARR